MVKKYVTINDSIKPKKATSKKNTGTILHASFFFALLFIAASLIPAHAQSLNQYFEQKSNGFISPDLAFFDHNSKPAFVSVESGTLNAFAIGNESAVWKYKMRANSKIRKLPASFDRSKLMLLYEDNSFDIIALAGGALVYSETAPSPAIMVSPAPRGFVVIKNGAAYEFTDGAGEKLNAIAARDALALDSIITDGGIFYFSVLGPSGFEIFGGSSAAGAKKVSGAEIGVSFSAKALLYFNVKNGSETLKYALADNGSVKIYDCHAPEAVYKNEMKTGTPVLALYGCNGLADSSSAVIAKCENSYHGFSDGDFSPLFTLPAKARNSCLPAAIHAKGAGPFFLYYSSNDTIALYNIATKSPAAEYRLEQKPLAASVCGRYSKDSGAAFFLVPFASSVLCVQIQGLAAAEDFYFSSDMNFAATRMEPAGYGSLAAPEMLKNIDKKKIVEFYNSHKNETHMAAGAFILILALLFFRKRLRAPGRHSAKAGGDASAGQIERLKEMLAASPENVELILNLIQLLKKEEKYEEAAEYYKNLIKLRPQEEQYYEELLDLGQGYFHFTGELVAIYKKKARIKTVIAAYEGRKAALTTADKNYIFVARILSRLYIEDKPYQGEGQAVSPENSKKAIALIEEILKIEANSIDELTTLAALYTRTEEHEKAAETLKKLVEIDRSNNLVNHYSSLFSIYNRLAQPEEAAEIFRVVMELKTSAAETILPLALEYFNESFKNGNKKAVLIYGDCIVSAYNRQKNVNAALGVIDRILAAYPQEKAMLRRKAFLMLENEVETNILDIFKQLCDMFPGDARIKFEYCRLLYKNKKYDESLTIIFDSLKKKENEDKYAELFCLIAGLLIKEKNYQRVIDLAPSAYKLTQKASCLKCLAEAYLKSGDIDRANDIYLKTVELAPGDSEVLKRQKYVKTLIDERGIIEMKTAGTEDIELTVDGEPVAVKRTAIDMESRVQVSPFEIQTAEAKLFYEKGDYKKAIPLLQQLLKTAPESKRALVISIYLINCFLKEGMAAAAEKVYDSVDPEAMKLSPGEQLAFKFKAGGIFLENDRLEKAEAVFSEVAAIDMGYKNVGEAISSIKNKIAERRAEAQKFIAAQSAPDDSERTMIATVATETDYVDKRYKILGQLGKGGMGIVYRATDTETGSTVAIKIPILSFKDDRGFMDRFEREADLSSRLKHPNVLNIFSVVKGELPYMVMELLNGRSLKELLKEKKSFTPVQMRDIAVQCCDALAYTHGLNIIHRDIKPENIMIVEQNAVKIMDFGLAKALDESSMTRAGTIMGTFAYISPEQCVGEQVDGRADIYSLGIMLYEMLAGEKPFTSGDYVHQHLKVKPQAPTKKNPLIPYPVEAVVLKCIEKKPQDRYATASDLREALLKIA